MTYFLYKQSRSTANGPWRTVPWALGPGPWPLGPGPWALALGPGPWPQWALGPGSKWFLACASLQQPLFFLGRCPNYCTTTYQIGLNCHYFNQKMPRAMNHCCRIQPSSTREGRFSFPRTQTPYCIKFLRRGAERARNALLHRRHKIATRGASPRAPTLCSLGVAWHLQPKLPTWDKYVSLLDTHV